MNKLKRSFFIPVLLCFLLCSHLIYASAPSSIDNDLKEFYTSVKQVQKQLVYVAEAAYVNTVEGKSNANLDKLIKSANNQTLQISSQLLNYGEGLSLNFSQRTLLASLQSAIRYLNYLQEILTLYITDTDPSEQYQALSLFTLSNSLLNVTLQGFSSV